MVDATTFTYDGINSDDFDLMVYFIGDPGTVEDDTWSVDIDEERIPLRQDPIFYGIDSNKEATYEWVVGSKTYIDRETVEQILDWLTSHNGYKWLEIDQDDLSDFRYKAIFSEINMMSINGLPFAFKATVTLDSQFAYSHPIRNTYDIQDGMVVSSTGSALDSIVYENESSHYGYLYPKLEVSTSVGGSIAITNTSDNNRVFQLNIPSDYVINDGSENVLITIDNKNQIIRCNSDNVNIYDMFKDDAGNHYFFRLVDGKNVLTFTGSALVTIESEFLRKVGM